VDQEKESMNGWMKVIERSASTYPGVEKEDFSVHIAISHAATSWQPAAAAKPSTAAMTGTGEVRILVINSVAALKTDRWNSFPASGV